MAKFAVQMLKDTDDGYVHAILREVTHSNGSKEYRIWARSLEKEINLYTKDASEAWAVLNVVTNGWRIHGFAGFA